MLSLIEFAGGGCYSPEMEAGSREAAAAIEMLVERVDETDWNFKWDGMARLGPTAKCSNSRVNVRSLSLCDGAFLPLQKKIGKRFFFQNRKSGHPMTGGVT